MDAKSLSLCMLGVVALAITSWWGCFPTSPDAPESSVGRASGGAVHLAHVALPPPIVGNAGQLDARVSHYLRGREATVFFTAKGITIALEAPAVTAEDASEPGAALVRANLDTTPPARRWAIALEFIGARATVWPRGVDPLPTTVGEFHGPRERWRTALPAFGAIEYRDLWPGIDLRYAVEGEGLTYELRLRPFADPRQIQIAYRGPTAVGRTPHGALAVTTPLGTLLDAPPIAYQPSAAGRTPVAATYEIRSSSPVDVPQESHAEEPVVGFALGDYDPSQPLIVDPAVVVYAGFIGNDSSGFGVAADATGNAYVVGAVPGELDFPETVGPDLEYGGGTLDAFVAKVGPDGTTLVYAGYIGGAGDDAGLGVAVDGDGSAYVVGSTTSLQDSFPVAGGPHTTYNGGTSDAFVAKVAPDGASLVYAGYFGGSDSDVGRSIAVDANGQAVLAGITSSANLPTTVGPDLTYNGSGEADAFVAKVAADGASLVYAGYIGGAAIDQAYGVALDDTGSAYVGGLTDSTETSFPATVGPDLTHNGARDAFVAKVKPDGSGLVYAGYVGGEGLDAGFGIAVDAQGAAYLVGVTGSSQNPARSDPPFPVLIGPDLTYNADNDAFIAKVAPNGKTLVYAGYVGGNAMDLATGVAVDRAGDAYVTGFTDSVNLPAVQGPDASYNGGRDAFVAKVGLTGAGFEYLTYLGGNQEDRGIAIAVQPTCALGCDVFVAGITKSSHDPATSNPPFPVVGGPDLTFNGATQDAYVARLRAGTNPDAALDEFLCDAVKSSHGTAKFRPVNGFRLADPFEDARYDVKSLRHLCPPASIGGEPTGDAATHLVSYSVKRVRGAPGHVPRSVLVANRLGQLALDTVKPERVLVPSAKRLVAPAPLPPDPAQHVVDHYVCYKVKPTRNTPKFAKGVRLAATDQFTSPAKSFDIKKPLRLCVAANPNDEGIDNPTVHLLCYAVKPTRGQPRHAKRSGVLVANRFSGLTLDTVAEAEICLPSLLGP